MEYFQELLGVIMTGILGILWWDLRGFRKEAAGLRQEFQGYKLEIQREREDLKEMINGKYLDVETHTLMCDKASLELLSKMAKVVKDAIAEVHRP